ncbi:M56 family metallopeptidase [Actinomadura vinacea]|uniref:M56 family metallopeptidase n=1 Tax=Actinomadura vinacea TaxID=115336 RepID=A0ABN3K064_9ACTN
MKSRSADTGNRAFWGLVAASVAAQTLVAYGTCCLAAAIAAAVRDQGINALWTTRADLLPGALVLVAAGTGGVLGTWSLGRSLWHTRMLAATVRRHRTSTPLRLRRLADRLGIGSRVRTVDMAHPFALTYGLRRPRVLVSTGLLAALSDPELAAVLAHERAHVRSRDPLKIVLARALPAWHFYLPVLRDLRRRFALGRELAADRAAIARHGTAALAGSLLKVAEGPAWAKAAPAMATDDLLDSRITQLETGNEPPAAPAGRLTKAWAAMSAFALGTAAIWSLTVAGHAMHCD